MTVRFLNTALPETQVRGRLIFEDAPSIAEAERYRTEAGQSKKGKVSLIPILRENGAPTFLALVGAGKQSEFSDAVLRTITAEFVRCCASHSVEHLSLAMARGEETQKFSFSASAAVAEGVYAGMYCFDKYLGNDRKNGRKAPSTFVLEGGDSAGLERGRIVGDAETWAKDLCNEPGNVVNPSTFAELAAEFANRNALDCTILDEKGIRDAGMNALWYVGKGSATPPRFVHLAYRPSGSPRKKIAVVGKGVTFDSGGLCIKTRDGIKTMKHDKSGACIMLGVMKAAAALKLPVEVHGIAGLVENMPDGGAYRPDDIIRAMNGKTIEVQNTDAEGRLTLADALTYTCGLRPDAIVDIATLTGAAINALGKYTAALLCDDDGLSAALDRASRFTGERLHRFTMDDEYLREGLKGIFSDLRQSSPDGGGTIIGGMFLREFVEPSIPWAHIDIAATGWYDREFGVYPKGASAYSLRTIVEYLSGL